jgi:hypothetical protein
MTCLLLTGKFFVCILRTRAKRQVATSRPEGAKGEERKKAKKMKINIINNHTCLVYCSTLRTSTSTLRRLHLLLAHLACTVSVVPTDWMNAGCRRSRPERADRSTRTLRTVDRCSSRAAPGAASSLLSSLLYV